MGHPIRAAAAVQHDPAGIRIERGADESPRRWPGGLVPRPGPVLPGPRVVEVLAAGRGPPEEEDLVAGCVVHEGVPPAGAGRFGAGVARREQECRREGEAVRGQGSPPGPGGRR